MARNKFGWGGTRSRVFGIRVRKGWESRRDPCQEYVFLKKDAPPEPAHAGQLPPIAAGVDGFAGGSEENRHFIDGEKNLEVLGSIERVLRCHESHHRSPRQKADATSDGGLRRYYS